MSDEGKKLPLAIRKAVRDNEAKIAENLKELESLVGAPVKYIDNIESNYEALKDNKMADKIAAASLSYLSNTVTGLKKVYKDPLVKDYFNKSWADKTIIWNYLSDDDYKTRKATSPGANSYNGMRINDQGQLELFTHSKGYFCNMNDLASEKQWLKVPKTLEGELPLYAKLRIQAMQPKLEETLKKIHALKGLEDAQFEFDAMTSCKLLSNDAKDDEPFKPAASVEMLSNFYNNLEKKLWKDDMIREAVLEEWKAPHKIIIIAEADLANDKATKLVKTGYNGIKIENGDLYLLAGKGRWWTNVNEFATLDLVKVL